MARPSYWTAILIFLVVGFATLGWIVVDDGSLSGSPGSMGDDVFFENIAFHIARNEGVSVDFSDLEWQRPYRDAGKADHHNLIGRLQHSGTTTSRSPGFPLLVSLVYRAVGRNFTIVRIVDTLLLSAALSLLLTVIWRIHGKTVGMIALLTISLDYYVLRTAGQFMTEALSTAIICSLFVGCLAVTRNSALSNRKRGFVWLAIGVLFGVGSLVRASLNAWFLMIVVALTALVVWKLIARKTSKPVLRNGTCFCVGVILVASPWWIRNCQLAGEFVPFGTSGSMGLVGGYCDEALANYGNWSLEALKNSQNAVIEKPGFHELSLAEQEFLFGKHSSGLAFQWISQNGSKLPALIGMKAVSHLGFHSLPVPIICINGLLLFGAMIGCYTTRQSAGLWIMIFLVLSILTTCLTWSHFGRYSIPLRPLIHVASAIGTVVFWKKVLCYGGWLTASPKESMQ